MYTTDRVNSFSSIKTEVKRGEATYSSDLLTCIIYIYILFLLGSVGQQLTIKKVISYCLIIEKKTFERKLNDKISLVN